MSTMYCGLVGTGLTSHPPPVERKRSSVATRASVAEVRNVFPVSLKDAAIYAEVRGSAVSITASLTYKNTTGEPIECLFLIPINELNGIIAVYRLEADFNGRRIRAEARSREAAIEIYSSAVDSCYNGTLLEGFTAPADCLKVWFGNLANDGEVLITIGIIQSIQRDSSGIVTLKIPSIFNPRYVPDVEFTDNFARDSTIKKRLNFAPDANFIAVTGMAYSIGFEAKINLGIASRIAGVTPATASDDIKVDFTESNKIAVVTLAGPFEADHDLQLLITPSDFNKPMIYFEPGTMVKKDGSCKWLTFHAAAAWFEAPNTACNGYPHLTRNQSCNGSSSPTKPAANSSTTSNKHCKECYWLLVDCSDQISEATWLEQTKSAIILFVKSLPLGCRFNIIHYGSNFYCLFKRKGAVYSEQNVAAAVKFASELQADMGSTSDILEPIKYVFKQRKSNTGKMKNANKNHASPLKNDFVFATIAGENLNGASEALALAAKHAGSTHFFTVAIGNLLNVDFVHNLARISGGLSLTTTSANQTIADCIIDLLIQALKPSAEHVKIDWTFTNHRVARLMPERLPNRSYDGCPIIQFALIEHQMGATVDGSSAVMAEISGEPFAFQTKFVCPPTALSSLDDSLPVHRLAAKARLTELSNEALCSGLVIEPLRKEAIAVSVAASIICDFTAFVAVDVGTGFALRKLSPIFAINESTVPYYVDDDGVGYHFGRERDSTAGVNTANRMQRAMNMTGLACSCSSTADKDFQETEGHATVEALVAMQKLNGSWKLNSKLATFLGQNSGNMEINEIRKRCLEAFTKTKQQQISTFQPSDDFLATGLALAIIKQCFAVRMHQFELVEQKAKIFMNNFANSAPSSPPSSSRTTKARSVSETSQQVKENSNAASKNFVTALADAFQW